MRMQRVFLLLVLGSALVLNACAPSLGDEIGVDAIASLEPSSSEQLLYGEHHMRFLKFIDARADKAIADVNGRALMPRGDIGQSVERALERHFAQLGVRSALFEAPCAISGEVQVWSVTVEPNFPATRVSSKASFNIQLYNKQGQVVYRAKYSGSAEYAHPFVGEQTLEDQLAKSMQEAIEAATKDDQLLQKIANAR